MGKIVTVCLDGTNNEVRGTSNTNVVRLYDMLDLADATKHVAYYAPGVGTFSSSAAWTPVERTISRIEGLAFGFGLRQELGQAYQWLMNAYEDGDRIYVFGFSRGAYTARALLGLIECVGLFRPGAENIVPYVVSAFVKGDNSNQQKTFKEYIRSFSRVIDHDTHSTDVTVDFVGLWDTVEAAGNLRGPLKWPGTKELKRAKTIRHAMSIDERRRPFGLTRVHLNDGVAGQNLKEVWFSGVHSDVGGTFDSGTRVSDIPLKWMIQEARAAGLDHIVQRTLTEYLTQVTADCATGPIHTNSWIWKLLIDKRRRVEIGDNVHASVRARIAALPDYKTGARIPDDVNFVDDDWLTSGDRASELRSDAGQAAGT